jgi:hypothetical protein
MQFPTSTALALGWVRDSAINNTNAENYKSYSQQHEALMTRMGLIVEEQSTSIINLIDEVDKDFDAYDEYTFNERRRHRQEMEEYAANSLENMGLLIDQAIDETREEANMYTFEDAIDSAAFVIYDSETGFLRRQRNFESGVQELEKLGVSQSDLINDLVTGDKNKFQKDPTQIYGRGWFKRDGGANSMQTALAMKPDRVKHIYIRGRGDLLGMKFSNPTHYKVLCYMPLERDINTLAENYDRRMEAIRVEQERQRQQLEQNKASIAIQKNIRRKLAELEMTRMTEEQDYITKMRELCERAQREADEAEMDEFERLRYDSDEYARVLDEYAGDMSDMRRHRALTKLTGLKMEFHESLNDGELSGYLQEEEYEIQELELQEQEQQQRQQDLEQELEELEAAAIDHDDEGFYDVS